MNFQKEMQRRIQSGESRIYPNRNNQFYFYEQYYFCNHTCTIYIVDIKTFVDPGEEIFVDYLRNVWREEKQDERFYKKTISYNNTIFSDEETELTEIIKATDGTHPESIYENKMLSDKIKKALLDLTEDQRRIIIGLFFEEKTELELAKLMNKRQQTIHYHKVNALRKLEALLYDIDDFEF